MNKDKLNILGESNEELTFFNGIGGFSTDGKEYVISGKAGTRPPVPWSNVIANERLGFVITDRESSYTWFGNSREFRITPFYNDTVGGKSGEHIYVEARLKKPGEECEKKPGDNDEGDARVIHGFGYTVFQRNTKVLEQTVTVTAAEDEAVKIWSIRLKNVGEATLETEITGEMLFVLGSSISETAGKTLFEVKDKIIFAANRFSNKYNQYTAFLCFEDPESLTKDVISKKQGKTECLIPLQGQAKLHGGSCRITRKTEIKPGNATEVRLYLGCGNNKSEAQKLAERCVNGYDGKFICDTASQNRKISICTPDKSLDIMTNGWLMNQVDMCRMKGRSALYQSGGAYGYRDQLQDSLAYLNIDPLRTKKQILLHASRQYEAGDVQHWWHEDSGAGIRTRYSDDMLWLVYAVIRYIEVTEEYALLDETAAWLIEDELGEGENERFGIPAIADYSDKLYIHCIKAIDRACRFGEHGLPLMGGGDWNDGMNRVGIGGKGESVWLGWFLGAILKDFIPIAMRAGDKEKVSEYEDILKQLRDCLNENAWDGKWFLRAFFDDGSPMGSHLSRECRIDSIAQSWAAISEIGDREKVNVALEEAEKQLFDKANGLMRLLTPPFAGTEHDPGYIAAYDPGIRENGGQYTHAAIWFVIALIRTKQYDRAYEIFAALNPINHSRTKLECMRYAVEPYAVAADVYSAHPFEGRGGWTWYTGSAAWMYRAAIEYILGFKRRGNTIHIEPAVPSEWNSFDISYEDKKSVYKIHVHRRVNGAVGINEAAGNSATVLFNGHNTGFSGFELSRAEGTYSIDVGF